MASHARGDRAGHAHANEQHSHGADAATERKRALHQCTVSPAGATCRRQPWPMVSDGTPGQRLKRAGGRSLSSRAGRGHTMVAWVLGEGGQS